MKWTIIQGDFSVIEKKNPEKKLFPLNLDKLHNINRKKHHDETKPQHSFQFLQGMKILF